MYRNISMYVDCIAQTASKCLNNMYSELSNEKSSEKLVSILSNMLLSEENSVPQW